MKRSLLTLALCLGLASAANAQILAEDFDSGTWPPAGWTVVNNGTNATAAWNTMSFYNGLYIASSGFAYHTNNTGGTGEVALANSDFFGSTPAVHVTTELWTPPFDLPAGAKAVVFQHEIMDYLSGGDHGDLDISTDGGVTWTNLATYLNELGIAIVDLSSYVNTTGVQLRFHYDDNSNWGFYWMIDDFVVDDAPPVPPPPCNTWGEDFDSGTFPPVGWTVIDNATGQVWQTSSFFGRGNQCPTNNPYGGGECAAIDADWYGSSGLRDSELRTPPFDVTSTGMKLIYAMDFTDWSPFGMVDISVDGGTTWTNLVTYSSFTNGVFGVDLDAYVGTTGAIIRFHYSDGGVWGYHWHVDDVYMVKGASATMRNGGFNPPVYSVSGPPIMGQPMTMDVDPSVAGHGFAQVFGYAGPFSMTIGFQKTILVDITGPELLALPALPGPVSYAISVPDHCSFAGYSLSTQAAIFTIMPPPIPWALTNAVDLVVGY